MRKILQGKKRIEQTSFRKFSAYHSFEARFTNPAAGNEKGGVEGLVGFARRNYMVPVPEAVSLEELNTRLLEQCQGYGHHTIAGREYPVNVLYEAEKEHLLALPGAVFNNQQLLICKVDKYATVIADKNRYQYPPATAAGSICIAGVAKVDIYLKSRQLATTAALRKQQMAA